MIESTFMHLPGVGEKTEEKLWDHGIHSWDQFLELEKPPFRMRNFHLAKSALAEGMELVRAGDLARVTRELPAGQCWRAYPAGRESVAYVDIETTGLGEWAHITTICLYDGREARTYVYGQNLDDFAVDIFDYSTLVTFNGRTFDAPCIERHFGIKLNHAHIDLRCVFTWLGIKGGLKKIEKRLGLDREELDGVDGYFAVLLWRDYENNANQGALDTLLAYNVMDTVNLEPLAVAAFNMAADKVPVRLESMPVPEVPAPLHKVDMETVGRLLGSGASPGW